MRRLRRVFWVLLVLIAIGWWLLPKGPAIEQGSVLVLDVEGVVRRERRAAAARAPGRRPPRPFASLLSEFARGRARRPARRGGACACARSRWAGRRRRRSATRSRSSASARRTIAYLELESFGGNLEYYVASAAQELFVSEATRAPLVGLAGEYLFFGGLFEKLGIELEVERVGRYKSAAETFSEREMSEAHREMANALLDSIDAQFVAGIAALAHSSSERAVRAAIDFAPAEPSELESARPDRRHAALSTRWSRARAAARW